MDALPTGHLTSAQRDELMEQVKQQIAVANAQELLTVSHHLISSFLCRYMFIICFWFIDGLIIVYSFILSCAFMPL